MIVASSCILVQAPVHDTLRFMSNDIWSTYVRVGIMAILQSRVGTLYGLVLSIEKYYYFFLLTESPILKLVTFAHESLVFALGDNS